jgi:hypothetical protein
VAALDRGLLVGSIEGRAWLVLEAV